MPKTHADGTVTDASAPVVEPPATEDMPTEVVVTDTEDDAKPAPKRKTARKTKG